MARTARGKQPHAGRGHRGRLAPPALYHYVVMRGRAGGRRGGRRGLTPGSGWCGVLLRLTASVLLASSPFARRNSALLSLGALAPAVLGAKRVAARASCQLDQFPLGPWLPPKSKEELPATDPGSCEAKLFTHGTSWLKLAPPRRSFKIFS